MRRHPIRAAARCLAAGGLIGLLGIAGPALAHTGKDAGPYKLTFGWQHEPSYVGVQNAVQLFVHDTQGNPLDDIGAKGLTVQVSSQGQTSAPLALQAAFDKDTGLGIHGEFDAAILPTLAGTYSFHITGAINGAAVDVTAASSDSTFSNVADPTAVEFPTKTPPLQSISSAVTNLQSSLAAAHADASAARASARTAKTLAIAAIALAVILALGAIVVGRKKAPVSA